MWLPTPIYERVPQFWLLLGLLFVSSGLYLGFDYRLSFAYLFVGALCVAWSVTILIRRSHFRSKPFQTMVDEEKQSQQAEPVPTDQTPSGQAS
ncbi:MAG: hypothetical protein ACR2QL_00600 [Woeseiaceae bacterium]